MLRLPAMTDRMRALLAAAALVALTAAAYGPAFTAGFVWDDDIFLTANPLIHASDGLYRFWFTTEPPDYFPLTSSMLWVEWRLWGMRAAGYHTVNVLLHTVSALLLWRVLRRLKVPGAWLGAALFALHPVAVESVAWITERKNTLPMALFLGSALAWLRFEETERRREYALSLGLFLLALLAKTSVVVLPLVLLGLAWWKRDKICRIDLARVAPFFALAATLGLVTVWYQYHRAIGAQVVRTDGLMARAAAAGWAVWFYVYKALLPTGLCFVYPRWTTIASAAAFVPAVLAVAGLALLWTRRRSWGRPLLFGMGYYVVALLPVLGFLNIFFMRYSLVADHWQYVALPGTTALVGSGLALLMRRGGSARTAALCAATLLVAFYGAATWRQATHYRDAETLWKHTLACNPTAWLAHSNLGAICERRGELNQAEGHYAAAQRLAPDQWEVQMSLGTMRVRRGKPEEAIPFFMEAIRLHPKAAKPYHNAGIALARIGRKEEAIDCLAMAARLAPEVAPTRERLAALLLEARRYEEARPHLESLARWKPSAAVYVRLGVVSEQRGDSLAAMAAYRRSVDLAPDNLEALFHLGSALVRTGAVEAEAVLQRGLAEARRRGQAGWAERFERLLRDEPAQPLP